MTVLNPSPLPNASGTTRGAVSLLAQSFAGVKTFLSAVVLSAGLQINGVLSSSTRYLSTQTATSTDLSTNGTIKTRVGFGSTNYPNATIDLFNSLGKAISISASSANARVAFDNTGNLIFTSVLRADMESDSVDWLFNGTAVSRMSINGTTGDVAVLGTGQLNTTVANTWSKAQRGAVTALTSFAASIAIDLGTTNNFSHTLTENTTLAAPSNPVAGQSGVIHLTQHASSPKTLAYNSFWKFPGGTIPTLTATNGATDVLVYQVLTSGMALCQLQKGVA